MALVAVVALAVAGCQKEDPPAKLDLSKDNSDIAEKMMEGRPIKGTDLMPKDPK